MCNIRVEELEKSVQDLSNFIKADKIMMTAHDTLFWVKDLELKHLKINQAACGSWIDSGKPSFRKGDDWYFIGQTRLTSMRSNRAQGFRIAENSAKTLIANKINQVLSSEFQNVEEGTDLDSNQVKYISTEASKMIASNID